MDRTMLAVGGGILLVGGLAYYFLQKQPPNGGCNQYDGKQQQCEQAQDCYWWSDGTCRNYPPDVIPCDPDLIAYTCHPGFNGMKRCDVYKNQCICDGTDWNLLELDSQICRDNIRHTRCWVNAEDYATCLNTYELGDDLCDLMNEIGCPCSESVLCGGHTGASWCDERLGRCIAEAGGLNISAYDKTWDTCYNSTCDWNEAGQTCEYSLDNEYAASLLSGTFSWEWGPIIPVGADLWIDGWLEGVGWENLHLRHFDPGTQEGELIINANFIKRGISKLRFKCCCAAWTNLKPKSFYGTLS